MVKFLHTADWQLGMTRHFLAGEAQARFDGARIDVIRTIGAVAVDEECDFVVVCGDVFESNQVNRQIILRAFEAMRATPEVTFYLLPGNHDPLDASSVFTSRTFADNKPDNVMVLESSSPVEAAPGVALIPAPWFTKRPLTDLVADACDGLDEDLDEDDVIRVVVGHGAVDTLSPETADPALISQASLEERIHTGQIQYVALGDRHSTTDVGQTGRIWYSGAPEPTRYDEVDPGNVLMVDLDGVQITAEPRTVGTWRFLQQDWELTGDADIAGLQEWLSGIDDKDRTIVKLALVGQVSLAQKARLDDLLEHHIDLVAALETWERRSDLVVVPDDDDMSNLVVSGFAREALEDLAELAESPDERSVVARDAMALLHRLAGADS